MLDAGPAGGDTHTGQAGESVEWAGGVGGNPRPHTSEITSFLLAVGKQEYGSTVTQFFKTSQKFDFVGVFLFLNWHTIKKCFPLKIPCEPNQTSLVQILAKSSICYL